MRSTNDHHETARFGVSEAGAQPTGWGETAKVGQGEGCEDLAGIAELRIRPEASGTNKDENGIEEEDDEAAAQEENEEEAEDDEAVEEADENTSSERLRSSFTVCTAGC